LQSLFRSAAFNHTVRQIFLNPNWTAIAFVRDPVTRVRSSYHQDRHPRETTSGSSARDELLSYLHSAVHHRTTPHATHQSDYCGLAHGLTYDDYFDIDDGGLSKLQRAITANVNPPFPHELLEIGWESCSKDGLPSIVGTQLNSAHGNNIANTSSAEKNSIWEARYFNFTVFNVTYTEFRDDYRVLPHKYEREMHARLAGSRTQPVIQPQSQY